MKHTVLLLIGLCLLLAACKQAESQPTAVAAASVTAPATHTPAPTQTASITPTPLPPTRTPTPTYRLTSTITPTPTETPYLPGSPLPPAPLPDPSVQYVLSTPDAEQLVAVANLVMQKQGELRWWEPAPDDLMGTYFPSEVYSVLNLIGNDFRSHYPNGFANASLGMVDCYYGNNISQYPGMPDWLESFLIGWANREQVVFQAEQSVTVNEATYLPYPIQLDQDPEPEWIVQVELNLHYISTWLLLDVTPDGRYTALPSELTGPGYIPGLEEEFLDMTGDFNGDGIPDIVIFYISISHNFGGFAYDFYIWNGTSLIDTGLGGMYSEIDGEQTTYEIGDLDGDGRDEMRVTHLSLGEFGCAWKTFTTYDWNGQELVEVEIEEYKDVPVESGEVGCYITQAMAWGLKPEEKTYWFEMAYDALPADASIDLKAWVLLRLMAAYYGENRDQEAQQVIQQLAALTDEGNFLLAVQETIASTDASPYEVCRVMNERSRENIFDSDIDQYLRLYLPDPDALDLDSAKVCPYEDLSLDRLLTRSVPASVTPTEGYAAAGFELQSALAINIDADSEEEWVAIYQEDIILFDAVYGQWQAERLSGASDPIVIQAGVANVVGGQEPDLLLIVTSSGPYTACEAGEKNYDFHTIELTESGYRYSNRFYIECLAEPLPDLSTAEGITEFFSPWEEYTNPGVSGIQWRLMVDMPGRPDTYLNIYEHIIEIQGNILAGSDLEASRQALQDLIAYIPPADPEAAFIVPRLQYLLGLSYEIEGRADEAVEAYLALIESAPQSAWSWLAWTRLEAP